MLALQKIVVGISGGVDSAVAALLLKQKGFNVHGAFMKNWDLPDELGNCTASQDLEDAKFVCNRLKIPLHEVSFVKEYWHEVFTYLTTEYENGFTPNPDVMCNKKIKFKAFFEYAMNTLKADAIATGHYARSSYGDYLENYNPSTDAKLLKAKDAFKDQTFFLSQIPQESLRRTIFPLGGYTKDIVKKIALENGLERIAKKPESAGICFIGSRKFQQFFSEYVKPKPGKFMNVSTGKCDGDHDGIHLWTIGQKCRIGGLKTSLYVVTKNVKNNEILVASGFKHPVLFAEMLYTSKPYWISTCEFDTLDCEFRFQHAHPLVKCTILNIPSGLVVKLERPLRAISPGQFAVFYSGNECLGSAKIMNPGPSYFSLGKEISEDYKEYDEDLRLQKSCYG